jgi:hypothetical protein
MNERIRELAEQAGFNPYNYQGGNLALFEKFAELIVKECQIALQPALRDMISRGHACDIIKKHFGVTE